MKEDLFDRLITKLRRDRGWAWSLLFSIFVFLAFLIWFIWGAISVVSSNWFGADGTLAQAGQWGDSFGALNALASLLGFGAILSTLMLQSIALRDQQNDQHVIRFETTFFELIRLMRELRSELIFTQTAEMQLSGPRKFVRKTNQKDINAIKYACLEVRHLAGLSQDVNSKSMKMKVAEIYMSSVHKRYESRFAPYFRIIYTILHKIMIDEVITESQKSYYGNLLRAQLTSYEISLLGFNATADVAKDLDQHLIHFHMFKYLPEGPARNILSDIYPAEAFAARS